MKTMARLLPILLTLLSLPLAGHKSQAVSPPPDGGYSGNNTAEGQNALLSLTTGVNNTAVGFLSLKTDTIGSYNTAIGSGTLRANNSDGNTATGTFALLSNTNGRLNTANGALALFSNTNGPFNTAVGSSALYSNTGGLSNTAVGSSALYSNTIGDDNVAIGVEALSGNTSNGNTAVGAFALSQNTSGFINIALGSRSGELATGSNNIDIGNRGVAGESNTIRIGGNVLGFGSQTAAFIAGISGTAVVGDAVVVDGNGQLGTVASSARFKTKIKPMDKTSEAILALKPVSFQYTNDSKGTPQFGLIAEEVAKVNPDLVVRNRNGEIYSVRYDQVNAMLLNEFLKEHRKNEEQEATIAGLKSTVARQQNAFQRTLTEQQEQIEALASNLRKVSAELDLRRPEIRAIAETR
jgi:Chaperone of endosialidase